MRTFFHSHGQIAKVSYSSLILILIASYFYFAAAFSCKAYANSEKPPTVPSAKIDEIPLNELCQKSLNQFKSFYKNEDLTEVCARAAQLEGCKSVEGVPLYHVDQKGKNDKAKNILVMSLIHGDETGAGSLGRYWLERVVKVDARNNWRIIPILNPDGLKKNTRANIRGVDLNRNFPTADWTEKALDYWKKGGQSSPRKYPGEKAASEPEVNCAIDHIKDFKPDFVVSIHTPLKVLDFDGPNVRAPNYSYLPWRRLGNFPGSLGRYLWVEQKIPVLTAELKDNLPLTSGPFEELQDLIGLLVQRDLK